jgi:hypothetical protein
LPFIVPFYDSRRHRVYRTIPAIPSL